MAIVAALAAGALLLASHRGYVKVRDRLTNSRATITQEWQRLEPELDQRAELVPELTAAVKVHSGGEPPVFSALANASEAMKQAKSPQQKLDANARLSDGLAGLQTLVERYPALRQDTHFQTSLRSLAEADNGIFQARARYNEAVQTYNTELAQFPASLVAAIAGFRREEAIFRTDRGAGAAPKL